MIQQKQVISPNLTPFNADYSVDTPLYVEHAKRLLSGGCTALAPFGTTGEANSLGLAERMKLLEAMVAGGVPASRIIPGTGLCALPDTVILSKHAMELGVAGVMTLPPFYYKDVPDDGLFAYFARLIENVGRNDLRIYLYHIPPVAKVGLSIALVQRLAREFPGIVAGIKDSGGDWDNTAALLSQVGDFIVFPGSELQLRRALKAGAAGCITATANVNAGTIRRLADNRDAPRAPELEAVVDKYRKTIQPHGPIPAMKALLAHRDKHEGWARVRAPLLAMDPAKVVPLVGELAAIGELATGIVV
jgi:4-hydroxy-tetrahydrodipicolinate synthase